MHKKREGNEIQKKRERSIMHKKREGSIMHKKREGSIMHKKREGSIMHKKREGKSIIWFRCLYTLWKSFLFCQKLTIGNLLEVVKYKIIALNHSQLTKGILQENNFNVLMEKAKNVPTG
jgi:hypothetical protein